MSAMAGRQVAVAGIGYSGVFRGAHPTSEQLTLDATRSAIADAGLLASEVDGIFEYQYAGDAPVTSWVQRTLGTSDLAAYGDIGGTGASGMAAVIYAIAAVASGEAGRWRVVRQRVLTGFMWPPSLVGFWSVGEGSGSSSATVTSPSRWPTG